jgi:hypothetical protein
MRKFLIAAAAGLTVVVAGSLTAPRAEAMPLALPTGIINQLNMVEQVALCFYVDGWNGAGMYECGYRHRRGEGWHGRREYDRSREYDRRREYDRPREYDRRYRGGQNDEPRRQPSKCPPNYTVQDGVCKPYTGR